MQENTTLVQELADKLAQTVSSFSRVGEPYALLDFPAHSNVGDSAIWLGEIALLRDLHGCDPSYVCTAWNYDPIELKARLPHGMIYLHGGGNLGDLWPDHQRLREKVLGDFPGRRFLVLPQSIHFDDGSQVDRVRSAFREKDVTLLTRDRKSLAKADEIGCTSILTPDAAFYIGPLARRGAAKKPLIILKRTDSESVDGVAGGVDWLDEPKGTERWARIAAAMKFPRYPRAAFYKRVAEARVERGLRLLCLGERVATDRLHAHILCLLLGIEHYAADNRTGKLSTFIDEWTKTSPLVHRLTSLSEVGP